MLLTLRVRWRRRRALPDLAGDAPVLGACELARLTLDAGRYRQIEVTVGGPRSCWQSWSPTSNDVHRGAPRDPALGHHGREMVAPHGYEDQRRHEFARRMRRRRGALTGGRAQLL